MNQVDNKVIYVFLIFVVCWFVGHTLMKDRGRQWEAYRNQHVPKRSIHTNYWR